MVLYISDERLGWQLMCVCVSVGFVSGQLGQRLVNTVLKKTGRPSYVVFLLGAIIGTATVAMAAGMIVKFAQGDFNADGDTEPGEPVFYIGSGFGCDSDPAPEDFTDASALDCCDAGRKLSAVEIFEAAGRKKPSAVEPIDPN